MQTRYGQNWWHRTRRFEGPQMSQDDAVALMSSPETLHIEVTHGERTTVVYAIGPDAGTVSWWRDGALQQEHSLRPSAHHANELYTHSISVHHDGGARVVEWNVFPAYGVVSRQEHHYPGSELDERAWHTMTSADVDLLSVPGPIDPRDVRPLVDPARLEITDRLDSLPAAQFGPLPAGWAPDTVTAPAVRAYGVRRVGESNALWGFVSAAEAERLHTHGERWCMDLQESWPGTASSPRITIDVSADKIFVNLRHGQHSVRGIGFDRSTEKARLCWIVETRWGDAVELRPPLWVPGRDSSQATSLFIPTDGNAEIDLTGDEDWTPVSALPPRILQVASVDDVASLALAAQDLTIDGLLKD